MFVLGIDPAQSAGFALLRDRDLLKIGTVFDVSVDARLTSIGRVVGDALERVGDTSLTLAIETQYLGKNPQTMARLIELRMQWEITARLESVRSCHALEIIRVNPSEWQAKLLPKSRKGGHRDRSQTKPMARELVAGVVGKIADKMTEDEVDACCIALFVQGYDPNRLPGV